jgi:hypothetical protein
MSRAQRTWDFLKSDLGRLLLGFLLTTLIGATLAAWLQQRNWEKQKELEADRQQHQWERDRRFEMLRRRLDRGEEALDAVSELMDTRLFRLRDVFGAVVNRDVAAANERWREYMPSVERWNVTLGSNRAKLRRLAGEATAGEFQNYETDQYEKLKDPVTIHGRFFVLHRLVSEMLECVRTPGCSVPQAQRVAVAEKLKQLDFQIDAFVEKASTEFLENARALEQGRVE